jgi:primosomal protein N' (replication factor Y)
VVLASATPSLESWANAEAGKYARLDLTALRGGGLPEMRAIDMRPRTCRRGRWMSPTAGAAVQARLQAGEQALLFLNRRGYAPVTLCRACGQQVGCDALRRADGRAPVPQAADVPPMRRDETDLPEACPACGAEGKLAAVGPGVERLAEEAAALFPEARIAVLSSDLFGSARALKAQIEEIAEGDADIIIGTQLVAKGHNFPLLTLVGVIDADLGLQGGDLRAAERTFQLMRQVAGRAGRADKPGLALLQTFQPEHPVIRAILSGDEEGSGAPRRPSARRPACRPMAGWRGSSSARRRGLGLRSRRAPGAGRRADPGGGRRGLRPRARAHRAGARAAPGAAAGQGAQGRAHPGGDRPMDRRIEAAFAGAAERSISTRRASTDRPLSSQHVCKFPAHAEKGPRSRLSTSARETVMSVSINRSRGSSTSRSTRAGRAICRV